MGEQSKQSTKEWFVNKFTNISQNKAVKAKSNEKEDETQAEKVIHKDKRKDNKKR